MDTLRQVEWIFVPCAGCGHKQWVIFHKAQFVLSQPTIACSTECLNRYEATTLAFFERQNKEEAVD